MKTKVLCIYLPQFHRIKENDEWWGEGFTEWTNVKRGRPYYFGHYQPRVPYKYYDLSDIRELENHIQMAQNAGIYGFAFYHYYFKGKTLLEKPIELFRDESEKRFPYCLIWANQSWTRTWYRANLGSQMLLEQQYGTISDWENHFTYLKKFFLDDRYIKIANKPVYVIYLPQDINCRKDMFACWDRMAKEAGFNGIYLIAMNTGWGVDHASNLYDSYMNFEPIREIVKDNSWRFNIEAEKGALLNKVKKKRSLLNYFIMKNTYSYRYLCSEIEKGQRLPSITKTMLGTFAGWDNTSRKDEAGFVVKGSTPEKFGKHIKRMLEISEKRKNEFLFLNAWNEWSEGAYIEPDMKFGDGYLKNLARAIDLYENE